MNNRDEKVTLVLYPNTWGIGYVICAGPKDILDFGLKQVKRNTQKDYSEKAKWFIEYCKPEVVILLDPKTKGKSSKRIPDALDEIKRLVSTHQLTLFEYTRSQVVYVFSEFKAHTKYEIAMLIISWYPQLKSREPHKRLPWMAEHYQMGVFDAFSLMLTHFYLK